MSSAKALTDNGCHNSGQHSLSFLDEILLHSIASDLDYPSILSLSATSHYFRPLFFPLEASITPFQPTSTIDYIPRRLEPPSRLPFLPTEILQRIMICDFESLRSLSCTSRQFMPLPPLEWFHVKLINWNWHLLTLGGVRLTSTTCQVSII
jgi:hypothetical protein